MTSTPGGAEPPEAPDTVTEALGILAADGYTADFNLANVALCCPECQGQHPLEQAAVERVYRFEGPSDPADEAIVLGVRCPRCGALGSIVSAFGPDADPETLKRLRSARGPERS